MSRRAWLHMAGLAPTAAPVVVLAEGPKRAHVRLVHRLRWNRQWFAAGSTRYVPVEAIGELPSTGFLVSVGRSSYVPQFSPAGLASVRRHSGSPLSDRAVRERLSADRRAGKVGVR